MKNKIRDLINDFYNSENIGVRANLQKILMSGRLSGTGRVVILPVDQGFEHGPDKSFLKNHFAYDPCYHHEFAIEAGLSAYAAPIGMLEVSLPKFFGDIPVILKLNSSSLMFPKSSEPDQAFTSKVTDAVRLGCSAVGITIYPGSANFCNMIEETQKIIEEAKSFGLPTVVWSYPRGSNLEKCDETAIDVVSYGAHIAALIGAHIIKVKPPSMQISNKELDYGNISSLSDRIKIVKRACFNGKRLVIFSGGQAKATKDIIDEIHSIKEAGASGSIIGRNFFQRPKKDALELINQIMDCYA